MIRIPYFRAHDICSTKDSGSAFERSRSFCVSKILDRLTAFRKYLNGAKKKQSQTKESSETQKTSFDSRPRDSRKESLVSHGFDSPESDGTDEIERTEGQSWQNTDEKGEKDDAHSYKVESSSSDFHKVSFGDEGLVV